jgi:hypothetical protein
MNRTATLKLPQYSGRDLALGWCGAADSVRRQLQYPLLGIALCSCSGGGAAR